MLKKQIIVEIFDKDTKDISYKAFQTIDQVNEFITDTNLPPNLEISVSRLKDD